MSDSVEKLLKMKKDVEKAKIEEARLSGSLDNKLSELKKHGVKEAGEVSIEELSKIVDEMLANMEKEIDKHEKELQKGVERLLNDFNWEIA